MIKKMSIEIKNLDQNHIRLPRAQLVKVITAIAVQINVKYNNIQRRLNCKFMGYHPIPISKKYFLF
jgi:hypothetical protein